MPRVLPSDVVVMIENAFPWVTATLEPGLLAQFNDSPPLSALVDLTERIPDGNLRRFTSQNYRNFIWSISSLRHLAVMLDAGQPSASGGLMWPRVGPLNALTMLWSLLKECPDEAIAESTPGLEFLDDDDAFRTSVRQDISSAEADFNNGEWKASTVMAGSALEALLLWAVRKYPVDKRLDAIQKLNLKLDPAKPQNRDWGLAAYIKVTRQLGAISDDTAKQAELAQNFRNLIHPGAEARKQMACDQGTARSALAAVDHVVRDLTARFSTK